MSPKVPRLVTALLLIAVLHGRTLAGPTTSDPPASPEHDRDAAVADNGVATGVASPWLDLGPARFLGQHAPADHADHALAASLTLAGFYVGFTTWTYFAWYRNHKPLSGFRWGGDGNWKLWSGDGWFGARQYAGGADKLGHTWATYGLARGGTELLVQWGGVERWKATLINAVLADALFGAVEIKDGFYYEFSYGDFTFDTLGALLSVAMSLSPRLDELLDFRVEYWPSQAYVDQFEGGNVNIAEDYTGETYLLALHLGAFKKLRELPYGELSRFVDVAVGFGTNGYKPEPPLGTAPYRESQHAYIGIALNAQGLCDWLFEKRSRPAKKILHGLFEVFNAPYGFLPVVDHEHRPDGPVKPGGA